MSRNKSASLLLISLLGSSTITGPAGAQTQSYTTYSLGGNSAVPYQPPPAPATPRTTSPPPAGSTPGDGPQLPPAQYAPVAATPAAPIIDPMAPSPGGPMANLQSVMDRRNLPSNFGAPVFSQPTRTGIPSLDGAGLNGPSRQPATEDRPTVSGIAPPLSNSQIDDMLEKSTGPALPDATLSAHYQEGLIDSDIMRKTQILTEQNALDQQMLTSLTNIQQIRVALAKTKLPIIVNADGQDQQDGSDRHDAQPSAPFPAAMQMPSGPLLPTTPASAERAAAAETTTKTIPNAEVPMPVLYGISGSLPNLTAHVLVPYNGMHDVRVGSRLPGNIRVISISAAPTSTVMVRTADGDRALVSGTSVDAMPPPTRTAPALSVIH